MRYSHKKLRKFPVIPIRAAPRFRVGGALGFSAVPGLFWLPQMPKCHAGVGLDILHYILVVMVGRAAVDVKFHEGLAG